MKLELQILLQKKPYDLKNFNEAKPDNSELNADD